MQIGGKGLKGSHRRLIPIRWHRDEVGGRATVNPRGIGINALQDSR